MSKRIVVLLVAATVFLILVDVARPAWTAPIRSVSASIFNPVQQAARGWSEDDLDRVRAERDRLAVQVHLLRAEQQAQERAAEIVVPPSAEGQLTVSARVVALSPLTSPVGSRIVTINAGTRDGVAEDRTVLNADGLVGRVVSVQTRSSDVLLIGDPRVVVGVRFGADGALGTVSAEAPPGLPARADGTLTLTGIGNAKISVGDRVLTLGSPENVPFVADIVVGTVVALDPDTGQLGPTAVVAPAVDVDTVDAVVVVTEPELR
ncbi:MAG: rod shape-determining protein MreC [Ornithinimicrobium sp.]